MRMITNSIWTWPSLSTSQTCRWRCPAGRAAGSGKWVQLWKITQWEKTWGEETVGLLASFSTVTSERRTKVLAVPYMRVWPITKWGWRGRGFGIQLSAPYPPPQILLQNMQACTHSFYPGFLEVPSSNVVFAQLLFRSEEVNLYFMLMFLSFNLFIYAMRLRIHSLPVLNNYHEH